MLMRIMIYSIIQLLLVSTILSQSFNIEQFINSPLFSQLSQAERQRVVDAQNQMNSIRNPNFFPIPNANPLNNASSPLRFTRSPDGAQNFRNPNFGKAKNVMPRLSFAAYADGVETPIDRGNPRQISNIVGSVQAGETIKLNQFNLNMLFVSFGQFIDHDLDLVTSSSQTFPVAVPKGDRTFDKTGTGTKTIEISKSKSQKRGGVKFIANQITSFLDGSQIYGSSQQKQNSLRQFNKGKLKLVNNMLTKESNGQFFAGDSRVSQNSALASIHTIFFRQHNRQCDVILSKNPSLDDETVFQLARNKVIGLLQKITFKDYLMDLLGPQKHSQLVGPYEGYNQNVDSTVNLQFSTAAFRFGHNTINEDLGLFDYQNRKKKDILFKDLLDSPRTLNSSQSIDFIINGMIRSKSKQRNRQMINSLRNLFNQFPKIVQDLFTSNVQRGRDHGLPDYNSALRSFNIPQLRSIDDISRDRTTVDKLKQAYNNNVSNIDMWVGIICEQPLPGSNLGILGATIVAKTFKNIRMGDKFWYENVYSPEDINEIESTTLKDIILRNTKLKNVPSNVFKTDSSETNFNQNVPIFQPFQPIQPVQPVQSTLSSNPSLALLNQLNLPSLSPSFLNQPQNQQIQQFLSQLNQQRTNQPSQPSLSSLLASLQSQQMGTILNSNSLSPLNTSDLLNRFLGNLRN